MKKRIFHIFTLLIISFFMFSYSQEILNEVSVFDYNFGGVQEFTDAFVHNNVLYVSGKTDDYPATYSISIFDITVPESPVELGRNVKGVYSGNPEYSNSVYYFDDSEYLKSFYAVIDTTDVSSCYYFWNDNRVVQKNDTLYQLRSYRKYINLFKIKSPVEFEFIRRDTIESINEITGLEIVGNTIYITNRTKGLILLDISNLDSINKLENPLENQDLTGIVIGNNRAIIGRAFSNIQLLDISNPKTPSIISSESFFNHRLSGSWKNEHFYISGLTKTINVFDENLNIINVIAAKGQVFGFLIDDNKMFVGTNLGIEIYDISDENTACIQTVYGANISKPVGFVKRENLIYTVNLGDGIIIIDVSNDEDPEVIGAFDLNSYSRDIVIDSNYAYVADYLLGLVIFDISDPENPDTVSFVLIENATELDIIDDKVFLLNDNNAMFIIDVANKSQPQIEYTQQFQQYGEDYFCMYKKIKAVGDDIWIKFPRSPLYGFDYSTENGLVEIFNYTYEISSEPYEFQLYDSLLFLTTFNGVQILDPFEIKFIRAETFGSRHMEESPNSVAADLNNSLLYISLRVFGISGIVAYDISTPEEPMYLPGYLPLGFASEEMVFQDGLLYILTPTGLSIYSPQITNSVGNNNISFTYKLSQNYPNPFNASTTIQYDIPKTSQVTLTIYNMNGQVVERLINQKQEPGFYTVDWDVKNVSTGVYFYQIKADEFQQVKKCLLIK